MKKFRQRIDDALDKIQGKYGTGGFLLVVITFIIITIFIIGSLVFITYGIILVPIVVWVVYTFVSEFIKVGDSDV